MRIKTILLLVGFYFVYLLIGATVFWALEFTYEERRCLNTIAALQQYNFSQASSENITAANLRNLVQVLVNANANGVQFNRNLEPSCIYNWEYQNAFFFAGTVVTTIGYGNISPATNGGRVFCIVFAACGLPIFAIMFGGIGEKFAGLFKKLETKLQTKVHRKKLRKYVVLLLLVGTLIVFCLLFPALIFMAVESWTYHEAFYFSFITLTTIGFGDYVVGRDPDKTYIAIYRIAVYFWILFGLAFMAAVINVFSDLIKNKAETNETNDDNGEVPASEDSGPSESGEESVDGNESKAINDSDRELTSGANSGDINMYTLTGADEQLSPTGDVDQKSVSVHNDLE